MKVTIKFLILFLIFLNKNVVARSQKSAQPDIISDRIFSRKTLPECPDNFTDVGNFCYFITKKSVFPPKCPFEEVLSFDSYKKILLERKIAPVWMPVQRSVTNGLGFLQWSEFSPRYKTVFNDSFYYGGRIKGKDCLLFYNSSYIVATSCKEQHSRMCAYNKFEPSKNFLCGDDKTCLHVSLGSAPKCICIDHSNDTKISRALFLQPYQNQVYKWLNEVCTIGLDKNSDGLWVWSSGSKLTYTFWSPEANFSVGNYAALTPSGWIVTKTPLSCTLCVQDSKSFYPSLNLILSSDQVLILNVSDFDGLQQFSSDVKVYCFTDSDPFSLLYRYSNLSILEKNRFYVVYSFKLLEYTSGNYWCEGVKIQNSERIQSNVISFGHDYEFTNASLSYSGEINPLSPDVYVVIKNSLNKLGCMVKLKKIIDVDEELRKIKVTIQTICEGNKTFIPNQIKVNSDVCSSDSANGLSWPSTSAGERTYSYEYCFKEDGFRLDRLCIYTVNGAHWEVINETCKIPDYSLITQQLSDSLNYSDFNASFYKLRDNLNNLDLLSPVDVYIIADFFNALLDPSFDFGKTDIVGDIVGDIVATLLKIRPQIITQAQEDMRAMDLILFPYWPRIIEVNILTSDFGCIPQGERLTFDEVGLALQPPAGTTLESLLAREEINSGIFVDVGVSDFVFGISWFSKDTFFIDKLTNVSRTIFGWHGALSFSQFKRSVSDDYPISVFYACNMDTLKYNINCVIWGQNDLGRSAWIPDGIFQIKGSYCVCLYEMWGSYYTLKLKTSNYITPTLEEILNSDAPSAEIMSRLYQATLRYYEFSSFDVYLVGEILKKISGSTDIDLELLSQTVNNMQKINRNILLESQINQTATDTILYYTDMIIQKTENQSSSIFSTDNFISLIYDIDSTDFSGCVLLEDGTVEILVGLVDVSSLLDYENMTSAVVFSPQIKEQIKEEKVVLNIYLKDLLFNEVQSNLTTKKIFTIFDIILPEISEDYTGPISIFYKVTSEESLCSYWLYDVQNKSPGVWKSDHNSTNFSFLVQCDFWHTTHFALLILDKDEYDDFHETLEWTTNVTCFLSLLGYFGIVLTAVFFKNWRMKADSKVLLNFVFSGILQIVVFYIAGEVQGNTVCVFTGVVLHYSVLAQFCWMLNIAFLQYKRFVRVFGTHSQHVLLKNCLFAWGAPLVAVIPVLVSNFDSYANGNVGLCYPSGYGLYFGVWMPICLIILINLVVFARIIYSVLNTKSGVGIDKDGFMYQWRLVIFLFFILGLTWIFGFLAELGGGILFVFLFCVLATLQGLVIFVFFILLNKNVRQLYQVHIRRH